MDIGQRIKNMRQSQNISMNRFAQICDVSQANLSRIETGRQQPAFDTLERIITALGFTLAEFFSTDEPDLEPDTMLLLNIIRTLTPEQSRALRIFLQKMKSESVY